MPTSPIPYGRSHGTVLMDGLGHEIKSRYLGRVIRAFGQKMVDGVEITLLKSAHRVVNGYAGISN